MVPIFLELAVALTLLARKEISREMIVSGAQSGVLVWKRSNVPA